jgi:hypothetical protein
MTSAVHASSSHDQTHLVHVLRHGVLLGALQAILVLAFSLVSRFLDGTPELGLRAVIVFVGVAATTLLPGLRTRARTIEGIAGAAGIGLAATVVFTLIDSLALQWIGTYTNRWHEIGGGSNWWYLPVWWMTGTYLAWLGAFALANTAARSGGEPAPAVVLGASAVLAIVIGAGAAFAGFPGAHLGLGTMAVAFLPAIAVTVIVTGMGARR